jgi:hypothetical protein
VAERSFLGTVRLAILLAVLVFVALGAWLDARRSTDWDGTLRVTIYPIAIDRDSATTRFVADLDADSFSAITDFIGDEGSRYGVGIDEPVSIRVSHAAREPPPAAPTDPGPFSIALWSLRLRYWAWRVAANDPLPPPDVQVFALYHTPDGGQVAPDSTGLRKGLVAVTHVFSGHDAAASNQVVLAHEFLHTLGATDKYDLRTGQPLAPIGLGDPGLDPPYPQESGEIMAGRVAMSAQSAEIPDSLSQMTVGPVTAREIGWLR